MTDPMEADWGPLGVIVCETGLHRWPCHWEAWLGGSNRCPECQSNLHWVATDG